MTMSRIRKVQQLLGREKLDALLVTNPVNLFYLFGIADEECFALITRNKTLFYVSVLNYPEVRQVVKGNSVTVVSDREAITAFIKTCRARKIGFETDKITVHSLSIWKKMIRQARWVATTGLIESLRLVKDKAEITLIRKAAGMADEVCRQATSLLRPGLTEQYIAGKIDALIRAKGCEPAFKTIVASGPGSAVPHHAVSNRKLGKNDIVMMDFGAIYKGYRSDLTRTVFLGKINKLYQCLYELVHAAQIQAIKAIKSGVKTQVIDQAAREIISRAGYGNYFIHTTGHGLGLETHEAPRLSAKDTVILRPGMVVTVEPGVYLPGRGGVRIEDMILVTPAGREVLTKAKK